MLILLIIVLVLMILFYIWWRIRLHNLKSLLFVMNLIKTEEIFAKYNPGGYLSPGDIKDIKETIKSACEFKKYFNDNEFEDLIKSLDSQQGLNGQEVEKLLSLLDLEKRMIAKQKKK